MLQQHKTNCFDWDAFCMKTIADNCCLRVSSDVWVSSPTVSMHPQHLGEPMGNAERDVSSTSSSDDLLDIWLADIVDTGSCTPITATDSSTYCHSSRSVRDEHMASPDDTPPSYPMGLSTPPGDSFSCSSSPPSSAAKSSASPLSESKRELSLHRLQTKIDSLMKRRRQGCQEIRRLKSRLMKRDELIATMQSNQRALDFDHKQNQKISRPAGFALAIRRNFGNVACRGMGAAILQDVSKYSVIRWEIKAGAAAQAYSVNWHMEHERLMVANDPSRTWRMLWDTKTKYKQQHLHNTMTYIKSLDTQCKTQTSN